MTGTVKAGRVVLILVVEDDRRINLMASDELQRVGFNVISAYSADEAIEILECRNDNRFLFADIDMPGSLNGLRLAALTPSRSRPSSRKNPIAPHKCWKQIANFV
jgi:CheY-like chemotaxis protein